MAALGQAVLLVAGRWKANRRSKTLLTVGVVGSTEDDAASADRKPWHDLNADFRRRLIDDTFIGVMKTRIPACDSPAMGF